MALHGYPPLIGACLFGTRRFTTGLKLTYFDLDGGRADAIRLTLNHAGIAFDDIRVTWAEWPKVKASGKCPGGSLPILETEAEPGRIFSQSGALLQYAGHLAKLYPIDDPVAALRVNEIVATLMELQDKLYDNSRTPEEKASGAEGLWTTCMMRVDKAIEQNNKGAAAGFATGANLTTADMLLSVVVRGCGLGDGMPDSLIGKFPNVTRVVTAVDELPSVVEYRARRAAVKAERKARKAKDQ